MRKLILLGGPVVLVLGLAIGPIAARIKWGYHIEDGDHMAAFLAAATLDNENIRIASALASEACGETVRFHSDEERTWWTVMAERKRVKHFFIHSPFRNEVWVTLGTGGRACAARFEVTIRDRGHVAWSPLRAAAYRYPPWDWFQEWHVEGWRLLERIAKPKAPEGVHDLLPGECARGLLLPGETVRYQARLPRLGRPVRVSLDWDGPLHDKVTKDGRPLPLSRDDGYCYIDEPGGGTYDLVLDNPETARARYSLRVGWPTAGECDQPPDSWTRESRLPPAPKKAQHVR